MSDDQERRFALRMIEECTGGENWLETAKGYRSRFSMIAVEIARYGHYRDIKRAAKVISRIGLDLQANEINSFATVDRIVTGDDATTYRSSEEENDPEKVFDVLLNFYGRNSTRMGWRSFLKLSMRFPSPRPLKALDLVRIKLGSELPDRGETKIILDLLATVIPTPNWATVLLASLLPIEQPNIVVARAAAQAIVSRVRNEDAFRIVLDYSIPLLGNESDQILLMRLLTIASKYGRLSDRERLANIAWTLFENAGNKGARAAFAQACALLATPARAEALLELLGAEQDGEHRRLRGARHIARQV